MIAITAAADESSHAELAAGLDEIVREGAWRMLATALEAQVEAYVAAHFEQRDEAGLRKSRVKQKGRTPAGE